MQRIQYSSDLKVPQAEIHLEELFDFMLDRGAVPDAKGIHMLRVSGLWTPMGTCLMLCPDATQTALRVSMPDDSDGYLSLVPNDDEKVGTSRSKDASTVPPASTPAPTSVRFNLSSLPSYPYVQIRYPMYEYNTAPLGPAAVPLDHWLAPLLLTLSLSNPYPTTFLTLPPFLQAFSEHSSIPCGILVMTKLLSANDVPEWETVYRSSVLDLGVRGQEDVSEMNRQAMKKYRERTEREERREREAINSPKLNINLVMNAALGALAGDGLVINLKSQDKEAAEGKDAYSYGVVIDFYAYVS
ncbi:MAG: hypothetical protein Q9193_005382 [Seirophora villosa]